MQTIVTKKGNQGLQLGPIQNESMQSDYKDDPR